MPNWCENDLMVEGPLADVRRFIETMKGQQDGEERLLTEEPLIPYPQEYCDLDAKATAWDARAAELRASLSDTPETDRKAAWDAFIAAAGERPQDGFNSGGYEWCIEHWGTKWGFCRVTADELREYDWGETPEGYVTYHFDTAWSPPGPLVRKMGDLFPTLRFALRYFEAGGGFHGILEIASDEVVREAEAEYFGQRGG